MLETNSEFGDAGGNGERHRKRARTEKSGRSAGRHQKARHGRRHGQSEGEQMSRWISWVLQEGHIELDIEVSAGWVRLAPLAEAAARRFRQHKGMDEDRLRDFLNNIDWVGRFQISDDGYLQKVPRCHRHSGASRGGDPWIVRENSEVDAMTVCEYCHSTFPPESLPFQSCWYCDASPSFHHGWCCPQNASTIGAQILTPSRPSASSHVSDQPQWPALADYAGRSFASLSSGDVVTLNRVDGEDDLESRSPEDSSPDSEEEAQAVEKHLTLSDDEEEAEQRRRLKRLSSLQQFVTSEIGKEKAILQEKRERMLANAKKM